MLLAEMHIERECDLHTAEQSFVENYYYKKALRFADDDYQVKLRQYHAHLYAEAGCHHCRRFQQVARSVWPQCAQGRKRHQDHRPDAVQKENRRSKARPGHQAPHAGC